MNCRSFVVVVVMGALSLVATRVQARKGDSRCVKMRTLQVRELLAKLAAASAEAAPEEKTEAELMYEAMLRWNGQPKGSAAIDRLVAQSGKEAERAKRATQERIRQMFWRDPFSDDSRVVPVRARDRALLAAYSQKPRRTAAYGGSDAEVSRLRAELESARAEAETARAEAVRIRERAEAAMSTDRGGCFPDDASSDTVVAKRVRHRATRSHTRHRSLSAEPPVVAIAPAPAPIQTPMPTSTKPAWTTGGLSGIIITPLESPPTAPASVKPERHARASTRRGALALVAPRRGRGLRLLFFKQPHSRAACGSGSVAPRAPSCRGSRALASRSGSEPPNIRKMLDFEPEPNTPNHAASVAQNSAAPRVLAGRVHGGAGDGDGDDVLLGS